MSEISISEAQPKDFSAIAEFAEPLWYQHYSPIIGDQQVAYMLEKFQSVKAIEEQCQQGYQYFILLLEQQIIGYFSIQLKENNSLFISKFYLGEQSRGKGLGKRMLDKIETIAKHKGCNKIELSVNKENPAVAIYKKLGFICEKPVQFDIGEGYIMDDYWMVKQLK